MFKVFFIFRSLYSIHRKEINKNSTFLNFVAPTKEKQLYGNEVRVVYCDRIRQNNRTETVIPQHTNAYIIGSLINALNSTEFGHL